MRFTTLSLALNCASCSASLTMSSGSRVSSTRLHDGVGQPLHRVGHVLALEVARHDDARRAVLDQDEEALVGAHHLDERIEQPGQRACRGRARGRAAARTPPAWRWRARRIGAGPPHLDGRRPRTRPPGRAAASLRVAAVSPSARVCCPRFLPFTISCAPSSAVAVKDPPSNSMATTPRSSGTRTSLSGAAAMVVSGLTSGTEAGARPRPARRGSPSGSLPRLENAVGKHLFALVVDGGVDGAARPERVEDRRAHPLHHVEPLCAVL